MDGGVARPLKTAVRSTRPSASGAHARRCVGKTAPTPHAGQLPTHGSRAGWTGQAAEVRCTRAENIFATPLSETAASGAHAATARRWSVAAKWTLLAN